MESGGLRERKKARTRQHVADTAARLFAEHGYENVTVRDVARHAEVAEQTVYNYFPTKERLVLDQEEEIRDRITHLIRTRQPGVSPAAAIRDVVLSHVDDLRTMPPEQTRGTVAHLAAISPAIRRLALEAMDRQADAVAVAITDTTPATGPALAKVQAIALAWVFQTIIDEAGRRSRDGQPPGRIADELRPIVAAVVDDLDDWLSRPGPSGR